MNPIRNLIPIITKEVQKYFEELVIEANFKMVYNTATYYITEKKDVISRIKKQIGIIRAFFMCSNIEDGLLLLPVPQIYEMHIVTNNTDRLWISNEKYPLPSKVAPFGVSDILYHKIVDQEEMLKNIRKIVMSDEKYSQMYTPDGKRRINKPKRRGEKYGI